MALLEKNHPTVNPNLEKVAELQAEVKLAEVKQVDVLPKKKSFQFLRRRTKASQVAQQD